MMAMNEPTWREEVELRFKLEAERSERRDEKMRLYSEHRYEKIRLESDQRFQSFREEIKEEFRMLDRTFRLMDNDLKWVKNLLISSNLAIAIALLGLVVPIAWSIWTYALHSPFGK